MKFRIALLRGINVGGQTKVAMSDLRDLLVRLEFADGRSLLNSGNLVFRANGSNPQIERLLEAEAAKKLGKEIDFFVRSAEEWRAIIAANPFPAEAKSDPGRLVVVFLKSAVDAKAIAALQSAIVGREIARGAGTHTTIYYPDGQGRSKTTNTFIERKLGTRATARNWNTILKLGELVSS